MTTSKELGQFFLNNDVDVFVVNNNGGLTFIKLDEYDIDISKCCLMVKRK